MNRQTEFRGLWVGCFAALLWLVCNHANAADQPSPLNVTDPTWPRIRLNATGASGFPAGTWQVEGTYYGLDAKDEYNNRVPFHIDTGAEQYSVVIKKERLLGIGTWYPQASVHVVRKDSTFLPALRFDTATIGPTGVPAQSTQVWDVAADQAGFDIEDPMRGTTVFHIPAGAPHHMFYAANNGSIGFNGPFPTYILGRNTTGRHLNIYADGTNDGGMGRFVAQGMTSSELDLVHLNGPGNQKMVSLRCANGITSFNVVRDDLSANAISNALAIKMDTGYVGLQVASPTNPLQLASGAKCTKGGVWTNASSRDLKDDIQSIDADAAREAVRALQPVHYRYKSEPGEQYAGFIAEDVPNLVATNDRKSLASMDIVAVLTKVVQDQDRLLESEQQRIKQQEERISEQQKLLDALSRRLDQLEQLSLLSVGR